MTLFGSDVHHESCEVVFMFLCLCAEVHDVKATVRQILHGDYLQTSHGCGLKAVQLKKKKVTA